MITILTKWLVLVPNLRLTSNLFLLFCISGLHLTVLTLGLASTLLTRVEAWLTCTHLTFMQSGFISIFCLLSGISTHLPFDLCVKRDFNYLFGHFFKSRLTSNSSKLVKTIPISAFLMLVYNQITGTLLFMVDYLSYIYPDLFLFSSF